MKTLVAVLIALTGLGSILVPAGVSLAGPSWVQSRHESMVVNHPPGWKVVWKQRRVVIYHPRDRRIWCSVGTDPWTGSAQSFVARVVSSLKQRFGRVRVVGHGQISRSPDSYGVRVIFESGGVRQGMLMLSTVVSGGRCLSHSYGAPVAVYDHWKRWLIPILFSFRLVRGGPSGQVIVRSPQGYWLFRAPAGWTAPALGREEPFSPRINGPAGQSVGVYHRLGQTLWADYLMEYYRRRGVNILRTPRAYNRYIYQTHIKFLSATDLLRRVVLPIYGLSMKAIRILSLKSISSHMARYRILFVDQRTGRRFIEEGVIRNSSVSNPQGGDLNPFTIFWVRAPAESFDRLRGSLWQIVQSFKPSARIEQALIAMIARIRRDNSRSMHNVVMARIRSNRRMVRQTMRTTMKVMRDHRQARRGWAWALADRQVVRDPQTGRQIVVPSGGDYVYIRPSGGGDVDVIQGNAPLPPGDLPLGFRRFEQVPLSQIR